MTTPKTSAPELAVSQASKEVTVNEAVRRIEAGAGFFRVEDNDATAPPGSCADGAQYIPAATATGAWAGKEEQIAIAVGANASNGWYFIAPEEGMRAYIKDENVEQRYDGSDWVTIGTGGDLLSTNNLSDVANKATAVGNLFGADISPSQITANQNDYNPTSLSTSTVLRLSSDASRNITGLQGGVDGRVLILANVGSNDIVLKDESGSSTAGNRFAFDGDLTITADQACAIWYDATSSRWRLFARGRATTSLTSGDVTTALGYTPLKAGKHTIPVLAGAMTARTTNGAAAGSTESTTNKVMQVTLDFDQSTDEFAQVAVPMPKSWDEGTVTAQFYWTSGLTSGNVVWGIQAVAISDDDPLDAAFGTAVTVTDGAGSAAGDLMISAETSALTIAGTPQAGDLVIFQVYRDADNGSDTLAGDAKLLAVKIFVTLDAADDA